MSVHLVTNKGLTSLLKELRSQGDRVEKNTQVGTLKVYRGEKEILVGIQQGKNSWILRSLI